jgi:Cd2+/Zn2+-exporting ATPase
MLASDGPAPAVAPPAASAEPAAPWANLRDSLDKDGGGGCCEKPKPLISNMYRPRPLAAPAGADAVVAGAPAVEPAKPHVELDVRTAPKCVACTDAPDALPHVMVRTALRVRGVCCESEVRLIIKLLRPLRGLGEVDVNVLSKMVYVQHCAAHCCLPPELIVCTLNGAQLGAALALGARGGADADDLTLRERAEKASPYAFAALLWTLLGVGAFGARLGWFSPGAARAVLVACALLGAAPIALAAARVALASRSLAVEMKGLMVVATLGALAVGEACDGALIVALYAAAQLIEHAAMERVGAALRSATHLAQPTTATRASDGAVVALAELVKGDRIALRAGEQCLADGLVASGVAVVSEAALTGEHAPRTVRKGAALFAGCLVLQGYCELELSAPPAQSALAQAAQLVALAQTQRPAAQAAVDRFARWWTPGVLCAAAAVACYGAARGATATDAARPALSLLLLACPCSLILAAPVPTACAIANAARHGVLVRRAAALDALAAVRSLGADKTGTLTTGHFAVLAAELPTAEEGAGAPAEVARLLRLAAAVEARSTHPLAHAVVAHAIGCVGDAAANGVALPAASGFRAVEGVGVQAEVEEGDETLTVVVGNTKALDWAGCTPAGGRWFERFAAARPDDATLVVVVDGVVSLALALNDAARPEARRAVDGLRALQVETTMLTGAHASAAEPVARALGLVGWRAGMLPAQKQDWVRDARTHGPVAMVGDGINDALALAEAEVGIAMGGSGTALACEAASIVLLTEDLCRLPQAVAHARRTRAIVRANIALSIGGKLAAAGLALGGALRLWMAVALDLGATLVVLGVGCLALDERVWRDAGAAFGGASPVPRSPRAIAREMEQELETSTATALRSPLLRVV